MHPSVVPALLVVALSVAACGGSDDPGATEPTSSATTPSAPSSSPTDEPTETVTAATGDLLNLPHASVRVPDGWTKLGNSLFDQRDAGDDDSTSLITLGEIESFGGQVDPDQLARSAIRTSPFPIDPKVLPTVEVDGVEMYHLAGKVDRNAYLEDFGAVVDDTIVSLSFDFETSIAPAERQQVVDAVLASFRWK